MNPVLAGVDGREKGGLPISIGTSLALEGAFGVYPDRPVNPAPIHQTREVWINVRTLIRNLIGCLPVEIKELVTPPVLVPVLLEELAIIEAAVVKASEGMARTVFYCADYTTLSRKFPKAMLRVPKTPKQIWAQMLEDTAVRQVLSEPLSQDMRVFRYEITGRHQSALIVTHLPVDLLARYSFNKLELLESHTGIIKPYPQWHTKLTGGKELPNIPFNTFSLQVFGDNGNQFGSMPPSTRREVLDLAKEDNWTSVTTPEKIRMSLRKVKDPTTRATLMSML